MTTTFDVYGADNTPLDTTDNPLLSTTTVTTGQLLPLQQNLWMSLSTWVNPAAGTYYLRIRTSPAQTTESRASNGFGLRAYTGVLFASCTTISGDTGYSAACPQIHGVGAMSIYANLGGVSGSTATFYLADVAAIHAGKTMQITCSTPARAPRRSRCSTRTGTRRRSASPRDATPRHRPQAPAAGPPAPR